MIRQIGNNYKHVQSLPNTSWVIPHGLGCYPIIDVYVMVDGAYHKVIPLSVTYVDSMNCTVQFSTPTAGTAMVT